MLYTNGIFQVRHVFYCHTFHFPCLNTLKIKEEIENKTPPCQILSAAVFDKDLFAKNDEKNYLSGDPGI